MKKTAGVRRSPGEKHNPVLNIDVSDRRNTNGSQTNVITEHKSSENRPPIRDITPREEPHQSSDSNWDSDSDTMETQPSIQDVSISHGGVEQQVTNIVALETENETRHNVSLTIADHNSAADHNARVHKDNQSSEQKHTSKEELPELKSFDSDSDWGSDGESQSEKLNVTLIGKDAALQAVQNPSYDDDVETSPRKTLTYTLKGHDLDNQKRNSIESHETVGIFPVQCPKSEPVSDWDSDKDDSAGMEEKETLCNDQIPPEEETCFKEGISKEEPQQSSDSNWDSDSEPLEDQQSVEDMSMQIDDQKGQLANLAVSDTEGHVPNAALVVACHDSNIVFHGTHQDNQSPAKQLPTKDKLPDMVQNIESDFDWDSDAKSEAEKQKSTSFIGKNLTQHDILAHSEDHGRNKSSATAFTNDDKAIGSAAADRYDLENKFQSKIRSKERFDKIDLDPQPATKEQKSREKISDCDDSGEEIDQKIRPVAKSVSGETEDSNWDSESERESEKPMSIHRKGKTVSVKDIKEKGPDNRTKPSSESDRAGNAIKQDLQFVKEMLNPKIDDCIQYAKENCIVMKGFSKDSKESISVRLESNLSDWDSDSTTSDINEEENEKHLSTLLHDGTFGYNEFSHEDLTNEHKLIANIVAEEDENDIHNYPKDTAEVISLIPKQEEKRNDATVPHLNPRGKDEIHLTQESNEWTEYSHDNGIKRSDDEDISFIDVRDDNSDLEERSISSVGDFQDESCASSSNEELPTNRGSIRSDRIARGIPSIDDFHGYTYETSSDEDRKKCDHHEMERKLPDNKTSVERKNALLPYSSELVEELGEFRSDDIGGTSGTGAQTRPMDNQTQLECISNIDISNAAKARLAKEVKSSDEEFSMPCIHLSDGISGLRNDNNLSSDGDFQDYSYESSSDEGIPDRQNELDIASSRKVTTGESSNIDIRKDDNAFLLDPLHDVEPTECNNSNKSIKDVLFAPALYSAIKENSECTPIATKSIRTAMTSNFMRILMKEESDCKTSHIHLNESNNSKGHDKSPKRDGKDLNNLSPGGALQKSTGLSSDKTKSCRLKIVSPELTDGFVRVTPVEPGSKRSYVYSSQEQHRQNLYKNDFQRLHEDKMNEEAIAMQHKNLPIRDENVKRSTLSKRFTTKYLSKKKASADADVRTAAPDIVYSDTKTTEQYKTPPGRERQYTAKYLARHNTTAPLELSSLSSECTHDIGTNPEAGLREPEPKPPHRSRQFTIKYLARRCDKEPLYPSEDIEDETTLHQDDHNGTRCHIEETPKLTVTKNRYFTAKYLSTRQAKGDLNDVSTDSAYPDTLRYENDTMPYEYDGRTTDGYQRIETRRRGTHYSIPDNCHRKVVPRHEYDYSNSYTYNRREIPADCSTTDSYNIKETARHETDYSKADTYHRKEIPRRGVYC